MKRRSEKNYVYFVFIYLYSEKTFSEVKSGLKVTIRIHLPAVPITMYFSKILGSFQMLGKTPEETAKNDQYAKL